MTQFESADITELEAFRVAQSQPRKPASLTVLPLLLMACTLATGAAGFNSSLALSALIRKQ